MILAAGRGTRMRRLTDETPKPLIKVAGRSLIDRMADKIAAYGIEQAVVNICYLGEKIKADLGERTDLSFLFSAEEEALETGGGVKNALPLFRTDAFFVVNSDPLWTEPTVPALTRLAQAWDSETTDILLLLQPMTRVFGHDGTGDYFLDGDVPRRKAAGGAAPFVYAGAQILHRRIFDDAPDGKFSLNLLYDRAERQGRLRAVVHDGDWFHVGTPEALALAEKAFS